MRMSRSKKKKETASLKIVNFYKIVLPNRNAGLVVFKFSRLKIVSTFGIVTFVFLVPNETNETKREKIEKKVIVTIFAHIGFIL
jgi:hypothetical protein